MRGRTLWILGFYLAKICNCGVLGANGAALAFRLACYLAQARKGKGLMMANGATQQIVGRERRERLSQLAWCGAGCFDSRRRVNSDVRAHRCYRTACGSKRVKGSTCVMTRLLNFCRRQIGRACIPPTQLNGGTPSLPLRVMYHS